MLVTSYYEEINKYHFVTFSGNEAKIIKEISFNDKEQKDEKINYLSSYLSYQLGGGKFEDNTWVVIIGNRGIGNWIQPNSLEWFYGAKKNNLRGIKFDVFYTKDKTNIIARGPNLWPSSCPTAHIYEKTFSRLKDNCTLWNGEKIMTLDTMLNYIDGLFQYYFLEFKVDEEEKEKDKRQQTIDAIKNVKKQNMEDRVIFFSYDPIVREELLANTGIIIARDTYHPEDFKDKKIAQNPNIQYLMLPYDMLTEEVWEDIEKTNKKFVTYTINDTEILEQYLTWIDMTLSDYPVELINYLEEREKIWTENDASSHFPLESSLDIDTV